MMIGLLGFEDAAPFGTDLAELVALIFAETTGDFISFEMKN